MVTQPSEVHDLSGFSVVSFLVLSYYAAADIYVPPTTGKDPGVQTCDHSIVLNTYPLRKNTQRHSWRGFFKTLFIIQKHTMSLQNGNCVARVVLIIMVLFESVLLDLHDTFSDFHLLKSHDLRIRVKRNAQAKILQKRLSFNAFGQTFQLLLTPGSQVLARDFTLEVVHGNGSQSPVPIDIGDFYHGSLAGDKKSWVSAVHDKGIWTILIFSSVASYYIEPLQNHDPLGPNDSMILYNARDVRHSNRTKKDYDGGQTEGNFCRVHHFPGENSFGRLNHQGLYPAVLEHERVFRYGEKMDPLRYSPSILRSTEDRHMTQAFQEMDHQKLTREPRSLKHHDTCDAIALADYKVYAGFGKGEINTVAKFLISVYAGVDKIFRESKFGYFGGVRIMLSKMMIFTSDKDRSPVGSHLLQDRNHVEEEVLLESMARVYYFRFFCLAHLTTQRDFSGVLGLACRGDTNIHTWSNGICSGTYYSSRNVGLSTVIDVGRKYLPLKVYTEVVAHEIGHNFGADHDQKINKECAPSSEEGGKYLMWFRSSSIGTPNHSKFSPCSRKEIANLLEVRAKKCLKSSKLLERHRCGNGVIDEGEECDVGKNIMDDPHNCCKPDCTLQMHAVCSPFNSPCCSDECQVAPSSKVCIASIKDKCLQETYCNGISFDYCPPAKSKPNGSPCGDEDKCVNGKCVSACILEGQRQHPPILLMPCDCEQNRTVMCRRCCMNVNGDQVCRVHGEYYHDGAPCLYGVCRNGRCSDALEPLQARQSNDIPLKTGREEIPALGQLLIGVFFAVVVLMCGGVIWLRHRDLSRSEGRSVERDSESAS